MFTSPSNSSHHELLQIPSYMHTHNFIGNNNGLFFHREREKLQGGIIFYIFIIAMCVYGNPIIMLTTIMFFYMLNKLMFLSRICRFVCTFYVVVVKIHWSTLTLYCHGYKFPI